MAIEAISVIAIRMTVARIGEMAFLRASWLRVLNSRFDALSSINPCGLGDWISRVADTG